MFLITSDIPVDSDEELIAILRAKLDNAQQKIDDIKVENNETSESKEFDCNALRIEFKDRLTEISNLLKTDCFTTATCMVDAMIKILSDNIEKETPETNESKTKTPETKEIDKVRRWFAQVDKEVFDGIHFKREESTLKLVRQRLLTLRNIIDETPETNKTSLDAFDDGTTGHGNNLEVLESISNHNKDLAKGFREMMAQQKLDKIRKVIASLEDLKLFEEMSYVLDFNSSETYLRMMDQLIKIKSILEEDIK